MTVWFQNKRQTERKVALHNNAPSTDDPTTSGTAFPTLGDARGRRISQHASRSPQLSAASASSSASARTVRNHLHHPHRPTLPLGAAKRPSLDAIATRAERPQPRTPPRARTHSFPHANDPRALYEHMPSSPPSPLGPARDSDARDRDLLAFGLRRCRSRPTLEWACAAARVSGHGRARAGDADDADVEEMALDADAAAGDTEDEMDMPHEALTPSSSLGSQAAVWRRGGANARRVVPFDVNSTPRPAVKTVSENDVMEAALALCGLGGAR